MKKTLLFALLTLSLSVFAADKAPKNALFSSPAIIWAGVDYSHARLIGPGEFSDPSAIFPGMLDAWNNLVLQERIRFMQKVSGKTIVPDIAGVTEVNKSASASQIVKVPGASDTLTQTLITPEMIAAAVKSYQLENKTGLGVVFIVDRLIKLDKKGSGAVYVVAFDVASREVLSSERITGRASGFGFRNYWFRIIKDAEKGLKKIR